MSLSLLLCFLLTGMNVARMAGMLPEVLLATCADSQVVTRAEERAGSLAVEHG